MHTTNFFDGNSVLEITVLEKTPPAVNDCDFDGDTDDAGDVADCDGNGVRDLAIKATSETEVTGEIIYANLESGYLYGAELAVSTSYDSPGVLFAQQHGLDNPTICVVYMDENDGTGQVCENSPDPAIQGRLETCNTLYMATGELVVRNAVLYDNGDDDGWADSNETVDMEIVVANKSGVDVTGLIARLVTNDPKIDCIVNPTVEIGDLPDGESAHSGERFTFRVGDIDRTGQGLGPEDDYSAEFTVIMSSDQFEAIISPQSVTIDLDLDASGGSGPHTFIESFATGDFGAFTTMNMDDGRNSYSMSDGWRCQYNDPDWWYANSYPPDPDDCYLAATPTQAAAYFWQIDSDVAGTNSRSYDDDGHSAYMGIYLPANEWWTTPCATLEAFGTHEPINLGWDKICEESREVPCDSDSDCIPPACSTCNPSGEQCVGAEPELTFKHQVSLMDWRHSGADYLTSGDSGVVAVQLADADSDGAPNGDWIKIYAYYNDYDQQRHQWWTNCMFDPTDDGNTEDDYFDPSDPNRRLGPSSTCAPEYNFSYSGDTDADYAPCNVGGAREECSGLHGHTGTGTWVESKFNLQRFRGRRVRLRFLTTALKVGSGENWEEVAAWNPGPWDDGWWIDDIQIKDALDSYASLSNDDKDNSALADCGVSCNTVTPDLDADPAGGLLSPGQVVELSAVDSYANRCVGGALQFRFWIDGDGDSDGGGDADTLMRGWTYNPVIIDAPETSTTYVVDVRCSSNTGCAASTALGVGVSCPWSGVRTLGVFPEAVKGGTYRAGGACGPDADSDGEPDLLSDPPPAPFMYGCQPKPSYTKDNWWWTEGDCCETDSDCTDPYYPVCYRGADFNPPDGEADPNDAWTCWSSAAKVHVTRGDLRENLPPPNYSSDIKCHPKNNPEIRGYMNTLDADTWIADHSVEDSDGFVGFWYLMRLHGNYCNERGSWQTAPGAEPQRDEDLD
jgi:hypothetical protein